MPLLPHPTSVHVLSLLLCIVHITPGKNPTEPLPKSIPAAFSQHLGKSPDACRIGLEQKVFENPFNGVKQRP